MARYLIDLMLVVIALTATRTLAAENREPLELAWLKDFDSKLAALNQQPEECSKALDDPKHHLGRLAFNSPRLLGGQAGRMGLSCGSCHTAGRRNSGFFIQQISNEPGKADISHHFLSSDGGDKHFNPTRIPDLADVENLKFKDRENAEFDALLTRLIEVEFDGQTPPISVFLALKNYLGANRLTDCESPSKLIKRTLMHDWSLIDNGLVSLGDSIRSNDTDTLKFVSESMRSVLETFYRFYSVQPSIEVDSKLLEVSHFLSKLPSKIDRSNTSDVLKKLETKLDILKAELVNKEALSFYNSKVAFDYLKARQ